MGNDSYEPTQYLRFVERKKPLEGLPSGAQVWRTDRVLQQLYSSPWVGDEDQWRDVQLVTE